MCEEIMFCDGIGPHAPGERRRLPARKGIVPSFVLCRHCFDHEILRRRRRNEERLSRSRRVISSTELYPIPRWEELEVYTGE